MLRRVAIFARNNISGFYRVIFKGAIMDVKPTGYESIPSGSQESRASDSSDSQLSDTLVNVGNSNEQLLNTKKEKNHLLLHVAEQSAAAPLKNKNKREELVKEKKEREGELKILQQKIEYNIKFTLETYGEGAERDAQLAYLNKHNLNMIKEIRVELAEINKQLLKLDN